jgi:hypothetical protein
MLTLFHPPQVTIKDCLSITHLALQSRGARQVHRPQGNPLGSTQSVLRSPEAPFDPHLNSHRAMRHQAAIAHISETTRRCSPCAHRRCYTQVPFEPHSNSHCEISCKAASSRSCACQQDDSLIRYPAAQVIGFSRAAHIGEKTRPRMHPPLMQPLSYSLFPISHSLFTVSHYPFP